jgi:MFS family permease
MASRLPAASTAPVDPLLAGGRLRVLAFCWLGWVFDFYDLILFAFTKAAIGRDLGLELTSVQWVEGWSLAATAFGGFAFGRLADRVGRRPAMVASIATFSLGALLTGVADGFWTLWLARFVCGFGVGGEWGIGHALVAEVWSERQRDRVHGLLQAGSPVAMALAAAVGCFLAPLPQVGWRDVFVASAALGALAFAARWALPAQAGAPPAARAAPATALWAPLHRRASAVLLAVLALHMAGFWCVYAELPRVLMAERKLPLADVGWFQIQVNAVHVLADVAFGFVAARLGRIRVFIASCLLFALGHAAVLAVLRDAGHSFAAFTVAVAAMGLGAGTWSCFGALFGRCYPPELRATAASTFYAAARLVQLPLKPAVAGLLVAGATDGLLWIGIGCALGSAALIGLLPRGRVGTRG